MRLQPKRTGSDSRLNASICPPCGFITRAMGLAMMAAAERHYELIADLAPESALLREAQMMGIRRPASADETGLVGHKPYVISVTNAARLRIG